MKADAEFIPVVSVTDEEMLDRAISQPFSYVSTEGPVWRTSAERRRFVQDERLSHLVVRVSSRVVGAVTWSPGQTPGFFKLSVTSCDDAAWTPRLVELSIRQAMSLLLRASEAKRVELLVATYNEVLLDYLTTCTAFEVEGVLRDRFFIDGRYWPAVVCRADLAAFPVEERRCATERQELLRRVRKKTLEDLTAAHDGTSWAV
ncbi:hypothetical protein SNA_03225 [Streptomyces natalensis ATCC 27448]|uniref:N-acetyltransferase domain-containing protein n=1 Tax=Streptomyces natalensis ATCC 27448 TaxID=1240678 RepID=A0A0D7CTH4_9ACTN|nr:hypothetical protein SNA_03225 [Streptomyces natalensis ATCC 27448]